MDTERVTPPSLRVGGALLGVIVLSSFVGCSRSRSVSEMSPTTETAQRLPSRGESTPAHRVEHLLVLDWNSPDWCPDSRTKVPRIALLVFEDGLVIADNCGDCAGGTRYSYGWIGRIEASERLSRCAGLMKRLQPSPGFLPGASRLSVHALVAGEARVLGSSWNGPQSFIRQGESRVQVGIRASLLKELHLMASSTTQPLNELVLIGRNIDEWLLLRLLKHCDSRPVEMYGSSQSRMQKWGAGRFEPLRSSAVAPAS